MKKNKLVTEFSVIGQDIEEHFNTYNEAEKYCIDLGKEQQMEVQFFSKEWINGIEGDVVIFKNYGEHL